MNPLTLVKRIQQINSKEAALGISEEASWHAKYKESAYVFVGGIPFDLTEGDLLAVFAQYGEIVDVNLVRDKGTGKSKGFSFIAYEDQRSTNLAVDNLNGANVLGRTIRVDHVTNYKKKEEEDEEEEQKKQEERGVCRAFQRGNCNRGAACKFSHNEQRSANTGWGPKDEGSSKWEQDKYEGPSKSNKSSGHISSHRQPDPRDKDDSLRFRSDDRNGRLSKPDDGESTRRLDSRNERNPRDHNRLSTEKWSQRYEKEPSYIDSDRPVTEKKSVRKESERNSTEDRDRRGRHKEQDPRMHESSEKHESEPSLRGDRDKRRREERLGRHNSESRGDHDIKEREGRLGRHDSESNKKEDQQHKKEGLKRSRNDRDSSYHHDGKEEEANNRRSRR